MSPQRCRLRIFVTHPVQYHVPLWRMLAGEPRLDVKVFYFNDQSVRGGLDKDFGVAVAWDVDLLSGYEHAFLMRDAALDDPRSARIPDVDGLLQREAPDWVLFSGYTHTFERQLLRAARRNGSRVMMRGEFSDLSFGKRSLIKRAARSAYLRWFYRRVDRFCYPGQGARSHLQDHGVARERLFFSPYSVDDGLIEAQRRVVTREDARAQLGLLPQHFVFLLSGKLIERKNPFAVLDAIERMPSADNVALIALGDGVLRESFSARARALLGDRFVDPGFVNQSKLAPFFVAADALVMPSLHETWGLVVNEAMHYGLPSIVSSQVGCAPDLVLPQRTGLVYPSGDIGQLSRCMQSMLDDVDQARSMGKEAMRVASAYSVRCSALGVLQALGCTSSSP